MPQLHPTAENGNNPKVVRDLLRHATYNITANTYDAAVSEEKREALTATRTTAGDGKLVSKELNVPVV